MSIEKRGENKWRFRVRKDGQTYSANFTGTEKEAQKAHQAFIVDIDRDVISNNENMKFSTFYETYLNEYVSGNLSDATLLVYTNSYTQHFKEAFGNCAMGNIKPIDVQKFINKLGKKEFSYPSRPKKAYSVNTINLVYGHLCTAFNVAISWGIIKSNPCSHIILPKKKKKNASQIYSQEQLNQLIQYILSLDNLTHKTYFIMSLFGGFRKGELIAVTLDDIDWNNSCIIINKQLAVVKDEDKFIYDIKNMTKSSNGIRKVFLPAFVMEILNEYISKLPYISISKKLFWNYKNNKPYSVYAFAAAFEYNIEKARLPYITLHTLRHLCATMMLQNGVNVVNIARSLGDTVQTVTNTYVHEIEDVRKQDAQNLEAYLSNF